MQATKTSPRRRNKHEHQNPCKDSGLGVRNGRPLTLLGGRVDGLSLLAGESDRLGPGEGLASGRGRGGGGGSGGGGECHF